MEKLFYKYCNKCERITPQKETKRFSLYLQKQVDVHRCLRCNLFSGWTDKKNWKRIVTK